LVIPEKDAKIDAPRYLPHDFHHFKTWKLSGPEKSLPSKENQGKTKQILLYRIK